MSSHCYINEDFEAEVKRTRKAIGSLKDVIEVLKGEIESRKASGEDVDTEELECYEEAMKNLVWREFEANDFLMKEISGKVSEEWYNRGKEQSNLNRAEEIEKRIMQLEILNAEIEAHHTRFYSGEADECERNLLTNRSLVIQDEMRYIDNRISELFNEIPEDDPKRAEFLKNYENFWAAYRQKLKLKVDY